MWMKVSVAKLLKIVGLSFLLSWSPLPANQDSLLQTLREIQQQILQGEYGPAERSLREALGKYPADPRVYNLLGVVVAERGEYREAERLFRRALELAPSFTGAYVNLGRLYQEYAGADPEAVSKAVATYRRLLEQDPEDLEGNYQLAVLLHHRGEPESSLQHLDRLPPQAQGSTQALALRAANYARMGRRAEAEQAMQGLLAEDDFREEDLLPYLASFQDSRNQDLLISALERLRQRGTLSSDGLRHLARFYAARQEYDTARRLLERTAAAHPNLVELLLELAQLANRQKDYQGALGYLAHARDLDPENAVIHFFFGMVCVELKLGVEAYKALKRAVELDSSNPYYHFALGSVALEWKDPAEAIPYLKEYARRKPEDRKGEATLAAAHYYAADYETAREKFLSLLPYPETAASAHFFLGLMARQENRLEEAAHHLSEAMRLQPQNPEAYAELGLLHIRRREYAEAEKVLQKALERQTDHYLANYHLLLLYRRTRDPRAEAQEQRLEELKEKKAEQAKAALRTIEVVRP